ncbi:Basic-leucine zipper domain-containing protein [Strongyloides ratti]|uniref:Basic-leucine zipper domain-containing protein n=1 Tax=Strongyloides ratti TaxID=34506 RepID=A0A090MRJ2_STRRB|nr:Basic-leucine zipper domain-containing protein [Strongyloides ratti]CEF60843.1 Basic-leucine zipper domain-containing protein [Strongyloides ratti]
MAAPPSADDLIQRSFFSSIFNVRLKTNKYSQNHVDSSRYTYKEPMVRYNEIDERIVRNSQISEYMVEVPNNISNGYSQNQSNQLNCLPINDNINTEIYKPPVPLNNNCNDDILLVPSDNISTDIMSPQEIYNEIITETAEFEHSKYFNNENQYYNQDTIVSGIEPSYPIVPLNNNSDLSLQTLPQNNNELYLNYNTTETLEKPIALQNQNYELNNQVAQRVTEYITPYININQNINLEQIIKVVIATMKESTIFPLITQSNKNNPSKYQMQHHESPEAILQRKRQQNNEAAARYRQRQKEAKKKFNKEINLVKEKNCLLKKQVAMLEKEIKLIENVLIKNS